MVPIRRAGTPAATLPNQVQPRLVAERRERLLALVNENQAVVVDMSLVSGIDSSGVASLLEAFQRAGKRARSLVLAAAGDSVMRVLRLARLDTVFKLAGTVEEALKPPAGKR